jgi:hypothetical protein
LAVVNKKVTAKRTAVILMPVLRKAPNVGCNFMVTLQKTILTLTFLIFIISVKGQVNDQNIRRTVLEKGIVDSLFIFGKWTEKGQTETHLKYLGQFTSKSGRTFKIINSSWFWGLSHRATSCILIFNEKNQYVGKYNLTMTYDLPSKLQNDKLVFTNIDDKNCNKNLTTSIDLTKGLPRQIFKLCNGNQGDLFKFNSD